MICDGVLKEKREKAAEIRDSLKNTFRHFNDDDEYPFRDHCRKLVIEYLPPMSQVTYAASLARQGYLTSVRSLALVDVDITGVPTENMAKLLECVTESVYIENLRGDVTLVFSNINCLVLVIDKMSLSSLDTQALVSAMDTRVKEVNLYEGVTLDLETLTQYDGTGKCEFLRTWNLRTWKRIKAPHFEPPIFDEEDDFEDYELVDKWVQRMEMDWGTSREFLGGIGNTARSSYMEILRNWRDFWSDYSDYEEYEESFEPDDSEEEKDALDSDSEEVEVEVEVGEWVSE